MNGEQAKCGASGKVIYATKQDARDALGRFANAAGCRRPYKCIFCDEWHLTSNSHGGGKKKGVRRRG